MSDQRGRRYHIPVFPVPVTFVIFALVLCATAGMAIGALSGFLTSLVTKCGPKGVFRNIFLGSLGFLVGFIGCILVPWPSNTLVEPLEGGGTVATTMARYQHPERVAIVVAVLLPVLHEMYRFKRVRANTPS